MIIPIRCFSCNKVIADKWETYEFRVKNGEEPKDVLTDLKMTRYCCRRMFLSHVDLHDKLNQYGKNITTTYDEKRQK